MTRLVVTFVLSGGISLALWLGSQGLFAAHVFARRNVRGVDVPVGVGVVAVLGAAAAQAVISLVDLAGSDRPNLSVVFALLLAFGFTALGLVDDLAGDHGDKGFGGHLRALRQGRLTTGSLKLLGGGVLGIVVVAPTAANPVHLVVGAALVALAANTANLFDRAPGRVTKVAAAVAIVLVGVASVGERPALVGVVAVVGAVVGLLGFDLRERLMLGDAGANPLGAVLGLGVVVTTGITVQVIVLIVLVGVNVAGERVSFSTVIDRTPPLRALDQWGRRPL